MLLFFYFRVTTFCLNNATANGLFAHVAYLGASKTTVTFAATLPR